jgi:hypothetical protein
MHWNGKAGDKVRTCSYNPRRRVRKDYLFLAAKDGAEWLAGKGFQKVKG